MTHSEPDLTWDVPFLLLPPPSSLLTPSLQSLYSSFRESVTVMCELELHLLSVLVMRSNLRSTYKSSLSESMQKVLSPNH